MQFFNESQQQEQKRVDKVEQIIQTRLQSNTDNLSKAKYERRQIESNYGANTRANYIETDDIIETNATLQQQRQLMISAVSNEMNFQQKQQDLQSLIGSPYFGRIDIKEGDEQDILYIGTASLTDNQGQFLIYDWRAPIASIYYNGNLGYVHYDSPIGQQEVQLQRKRQFSIRKGCIKNMFDTNETIGDEFLKNALSKTSSTKMKNIVATIQRTQNKIIRNTTTDLLIVQGAAGSGKTSTVMQRIAYLLYHSRQNLKAEQIILFSPNNLFSNYIAEVLPSLGEKNMRQVTLHTLLTRRLHGLYIQTPFERYEQEQNQFPIVAQKVRQYKDSLNFVQDLQNYAQHSDLSCAFNNLIFEGQIFFSKNYIQKIYKKLPKGLSSADKFLQTKNHLIKTLKQQIKKEEQADWVLEAADNLSTAEFQHIEQQKHLSQYSSNKQQRILEHYVLKRHYLPVYDAIYNDYYFDIFQLYQNFLTQLQPQTLTTAIWQETIDDLQEDLERHYLQLDDATAILYLRQLVTGSGQNQHIKYLFIDEMQDYSALQLAYIQNSFPKAKLTLLGDIEQNVYAPKNLSQDRFQILTQLLPQKSAALITLNQSYRETSAIINLAKQFIPSGTQIQTFNRQGKTPILFQTKADNLSAYTGKLADKIAKKYRSVAIITKNIQQAQDLQRYLGKKVLLLQEENNAIPDGIIVLPVYLAKGLEFDCVIGYDISEANYQTSGDWGILYTIATRALHELYFTSTFNCATIFQKIKPHTLNIRKIG